MRPVFVAVIGFIIPCVANGDAIVLNDGFRLAGVIEIQNDRIVVRSPVCEYHVSAKRLLRPEPAAAGDPGESAEAFKLEQPIAPNARPIEALIEIAKLEPFDAFGRRTITLHDARQREVRLHQGITEIHPSFVVARGLDREWRTAIGLGEIPSEPLVSALERTIDPKSPLDRAKLVAFLIQAGRFRDAEGQLKKFEREFPESNTAATELKAKLTKKMTLAAISSLDQALTVGQPKRAGLLRQAIEGLHPSPDVEPKFRELTSRMDAMANDIAKARKLLDADSTKYVSSATRKNPADSAVERGVREIINSVSAATIDRLEPMLELADQPQSTAEQRLALALSSWTLGPKLAVAQLEAALERWRLREKTIAILAASNDADFESLTSSLGERRAPLDTLPSLIARLPAPASNIEPSKPSVVTLPTEVKGDDTEALRYHIQLPAEYDRYGRYPVIFSLHGLRTTPQRQLEFWSDRADVQGAIVVAPEYRPDTTRPYEYSVREHTIFLSMLRDVRRRFAIDDDKVFLSGHELGAMAAWDLGMSHPDEFAGLIPICGPPMFYCIRYWPNLERLPVYALDGSLNADSAALSKIQFERYFSKGFDAILAVYPGRGREMFATELPNLFDWISRKTRDPAPISFEAVTARQSDRRFYWTRAESFLPKATIAPELFEKSSFTPARIKAKVTEQNHVLVTASGLVGLSILWPYRLGRLDEPSLIIRANSKVIHRGRIEPDWETTLRELRATGDRKKLIVKTIACPRL